MTEFDPARTPVLVASEQVVDLAGRALVGERLSIGGSLAPYRI